MKTQRKDRVLKRGDTTLVPRLKKFIVRHPDMVARLLGVVGPGNTTEQWAVLNREEPGYASGCLYTLKVDRICRANARRKLAK